MAERWQDEPWAKDIWWSGKTTRRRFLGLSAASAVALGATMLVPAPWREAFGQAKPYKIGSMPPLTGVAAAGVDDRLEHVILGVNDLIKAHGEYALHRKHHHTVHDAPRRRCRPIFSPSLGGEHDT